MSMLARSLRMRSSSRTPTLAAASRLAAVSRHLSSSAMAAAPGVSASGSAPLETSVLYSSKGSTRVYQLNRPKALNSLNHEMINSLSRQIKDWRESELCSLVIGRGDQRAFCAGGDVKQLVLDLQDGKQTALPFFKDEFSLNWQIARLGKPYVSVIDGIVMGGGCGIALPAPIRIATPRTHFAMPETKIGYSPDVGVAYYLAQLDGQIGTWLAITAQDVFGRAVYELGLATHFVSADQLDDLLLQLQDLNNPSLEQISTIVSAYSLPAPPANPVSSKKTPQGPTVIKGEIRTFLDKTFRLESIAEIYQALEAAEIDASLSDEVKAWAKEQKGYMDVRSPTGMAVAREAIKRAKQAKRLDVTLNNDMSMATGLSGDNRVTDDFITGVTAVLVTKTKDRPNWSPNSITDPSLEPSKIVDNFFNTKSPHLASRPQFEFDPKSSSKITSGPDSTWGRFRKYGLPSEAEITSIVDGSAPGSGAFKVTEAELIERVLDSRGEASGPRAQEFTAAAKELADRLCQVTDKGYLDFKREAEEQKDKSL